MWELIQSNKRKSVILFVSMGIVLLALGYIVGAAYAGPEGGGAVGVGLALILWIILAAVAYFSGDSVMLKITGAREVSPDIHPQLYNVVEEMKIAASLPKMPKVYIIETDAMNAFATGRSPETAAVAVTAGLLAKLNRDELQGVVAHEVGHILNRDILFITFAGVMLGAVIIISQGFLRSLWFSGGRSARYRSRSSRDGGGQGQAIAMVVAIVFAILAPILAQILYYAISRRREYLADATSVRLTRYPEGLASALEKLSQSTADFPRVNKASAPMFIVNPLKAAGARLSNLSATHPPIDERIKILRAIAGGAGYLNYQSAYERVRGKRQSLIPPSALAEKENVALRGPLADLTAAASKPAGGKRELGDIMRAANGFLFLTCACGLKMKIPPDFKRDHVKCPRCNRENQVPVAELAMVSGALEAIEKGQKQTAAGATGEMQRYKRMSHGWESFRCRCGHTLQLSPGFSADRIKCSSCGQVTKIE